MTATTSRRAILAGAAAISALSLPAIATSAFALPLPPEGFTVVYDDNGKRWFKADAPDPIFTGKATGG